MAQKIGSRRVIATVVVAILLVTSCASFQAIELRQGDVQQQIKIGDTVRVVTNDGQKRTLRVWDMTSEALYGEGPKIFDEGKVLFDEIDTLEKKNVKQVNSPLLVYGSIALGLLILHNASEQSDLVFGNKDNN